MDFKVETVLLLIFMLFFHIVDDYYLQGFLANAKQRTWWEKNAPDKLYKHDYLMALIEHSFSWSVMVFIPLICYFCFVLHESVPRYFIIVLCANIIVHAVTDHLKANLRKINLIQDQSIHFFQIVLTWALFVW